MTGIVAARKKEIDIALGNIIWSTIFNTMWILWITAIIAPVVVPSSVQVDIAINMVAVVLLFVVMFTGKKYVLERWEGILMLGIYLVYMTYTVSSYVL
jgi:cation:H+ antiporter